MPTLQVIMHTAYCLSSLYLLCIFYIQVQNTANTYTKYCCILKSSKFACIQMNNPFTAGFPHTGLPGGYSVELVCQTLIYYSGLYTFSDQHHYLLHLALTVAMNHDYSTTFMFFFLQDLSPQISRRCRCFKPSTGMHTPV